MMAVQPQLRPQGPAHVAVIMDGNRRWAVRANVPLAEGYRRGILALRAAVMAATEIGVRVLTVYGFSTENGHRPREEIALLMQLCSAFARNERELLARQGVRVRILGDMESFEPSARAALSSLVEGTRANARLTLNLALNYSGRSEILHAVRSIAQDVASGALNASAIDEATVRSRLYAPGMPDPDMLIRTGGDLRVSNFLLYQLAYTELVSLPVLWPEFTACELLKAVDGFARRERRFGA